MTQPRKPILLTGASASPTPASRPSGSPTPRSPTSEIIRSDTTWPPFGGYSPNPGWGSYPGWGYGGPALGTATSTAGLDTSEATTQQSSGMVLISSTVAVRLTPRTS